MARFKGTVFLSARLFAEQRFGPQAVDEVLARLESEHREQLSGVTPVGWYPTEPVMAFHRTLDEVYGPGDLSLCVELGKFSADWALNNVLKFFLRFRSPNWIIDRSTSLWGRYHDSGRWQMRSDVPDTPLFGRLYGFEVKDPAFCARLRGWLLGAIELTGGKDPQVEEPSCACDGADFCEFQGRWL